MKMFHTAKNFKENLLGSIGGVRGIADHPVDQVVEGLLKFTDEPGVSFFGSGLQFGNDCGLLCPNSDCFGKIPQGSDSRHGSHGVSPIISSFGSKSCLRNWAITAHPHRVPLGIDAGSWK